MFPDNEPAVVNTATLAADAPAARVYKRTLDVKEFRNQLAGVQHWNQIEIS